jgi:hypothetical protein
MYVRMYVNNNNNNNNKARFPRNRKNSDSNPPHARIFEHMQDMIPQQNSGQAFSDWSTRAHI